MNTVRQNAIVAVTAATAHTAKEGYAVEIDSNSEAEVVDSATDIPFGVIVEGAAADSKDSIAMFAGSSGTVLVKMDGTPGTVAIGTRLVTTSTGTFKADPGSGGRVICAVALESGAAGELIEAALQTPISAS